MESGIYFPFAQLPAPIICFAVRIAEDPYSVAKAAQRAIWSVDKDQAVAFVMSMRDLASESLAPQVIDLLLGEDTHIETIGQVTMCRFS